VTFIEAPTATSTVQKYDLCTAKGTLLWAWSWYLCPGVSGYRYPFLGLVNKIRDTVTLLGIFFFVTGKMLFNSTQLWCACYIMKCWTSPRFSFT